MKTPRRILKRARRAFSLVEMLVALTISATLLTATLAALDASFKSYKVTTESVSTHVVGRLVMHRLSTVIRTGESFAPYPVNPIIQPSLTTNVLEFVTIPDPTIDVRQIWRIERVTVDGPTGPFELRATVEHYEDGELISSTERTLIRRVQQCVFTLEYDVGPRLQRCTIDLILQADDVQADTIGGKLAAPAVRLVASVSPRRLDID